MLNIYPVALELSREAARVAVAIGPHDPDLMRQLKRASTSVPLLLAEGSYSQGGNARGSCAEARAPSSTSASVSVRARLLERDL
jgi:hypothetical protein